MDHEVLKAGIFCLDRLDPLDDLGGFAAEPGLLLYAFAQARDRGRRTRRAPSPALLVGVAHEAERRKPLVALVMRRFELADRLFLAVGEVDAGTPDHVLPELDRPAMLQTRIVEGAHHV